MSHDALFPAETRLRVRKQTVSLPFQSQILVLMKINFITSLCEKRLNERFSSSPSAFIKLFCHYGFLINTFTITCGHRYHTSFLFEKRNVLLIVLNFKL